ncbi:hypothetical protein [Pedobacter sp. MW01-1-1]|uniref:hypothetical protein n=1 Tax=Pedobacter sp. MW01-1-1 TaxID=3383027 RepID=UPI003FEF9966
MKLAQAINCFFLASGMLFLASCSNDSEPAKVIDSQLSTTVKSPFKFYKDIEVKPGLNFEFFSWGKGVDSIGAYQILMSDSARNAFKSTSVERKGILTDVWNMDLDNDGNPEFYIQLLSKKNISDLNVFEYAGGSFNKINFPSLTSNQKKGYSGEDKFFQKNGDLFRSFPIIDPADSTKKIIKTYQYKFSGNSFSMQELQGVETKK